MTSNLHDKLNGIYTAKPQGEYLQVFAKMIVDGKIQYSDLRAIGGDWLVGEVKK